MGNEIRRVELRLAKLERLCAEQRGMVERLQQVIGAVAESAGSALAVEALTELAGVPAVEAKMREVARRKQTEAEGVMAGRVKAAVAAGRLVPGEVVTEQSLIVGERREGETVRYRVDLHPAPKGYAGRKVGDVVEDEGGTKTEIREVYEVVEVGAAPATAAPTSTYAEQEEPKAGGEILMAAYHEPFCELPTQEQVRAAAAKAKEEAPGPRAEAGAEPVPPEPVPVPDAPPEPAPAP